MSVEIRPLDPADAAGLATWVEIVSTVTPEAPTSIEEERWQDATYPGGARFLALLDGRPEGAATTGRIHVYEPAYERFWFGAWVRPAARRRGLGTALWHAASAVARAAGKTGFQTDLSEVQADGVAFLEHRGFRVVERGKMVRLDLRELTPPAVDPPAGIALTTLAARPDLGAGLYEVALEAFADIPVADEPVTPGTLDEFLAANVHRANVPAGGLAIALDASSGVVAGWASLLLVPGRPGVAWHDMTAVRRSFRGRGVATALKRATIAWAIEHGLEALETGNDEANAPMRAVNAKLGYRPIPDDLTMRGPLAPATA